MYIKSSIKALFFSVFCCELLAMESNPARLLDPLGDGKSSLTLLRSSGTDLDIVNAARVSYNKHSDAFCEADKKILTTLIQSGHETPFEQTFLQFHVKLPIFVARQWMRHRVGVSYNEQSARYTHMEQEFYIPAEWRISDSKYRTCSEQEKLVTDDQARSIYANALSACSQAYEALLKKGVPRELARGVLPVSLYTQFVFACNMRSLFHFAQLRADSHAQWEIQQYAKGMMKLARADFPYSVDIWCKTHNIPWLEEQQ